MISASDALAKAADYLADAEDTFTRVENVPASDSEDANEWIHIYAEMAQAWTAFAVARNAIEVDE